MRKTTVAAILLGTLGASVTGPAYAVANVGTWTSIFRGTPAELFTDDDWAAFKASLNDALNEAKDGETRNWGNPATGAGGEITILKTVVRSNSDCREVKIANQAKNRKRTTGQVFCVGGDGVWKLGPARKK
jgi:surface antigen